MADQDQTNGGRQGQQRQQRREPPRLVITHHEPGRVQKLESGRYRLPLKIWVEKQNRPEPEEIFCRVRVNQANITEEELLGEDGMTEFLLETSSLKPYVEVQLRWRFEESPGWRKLGHITIPDPDRDPEDDMLFQRMALAFFRWIGWVEKSQPQPSDPNVVEGEIVEGEEKDNV